MSWRPATARLPTASRSRAISFNSFTATFAGNPVFSAEFGSGIAANPFIAFSMRVPGPGEFELTWIDDQGNKTVEKAVLNIVPGPPPG